MQTTDKNRTRTNPLSVDHAGTQVLMLLFGLDSLMSILLLNEKSHLNSNRQFYPTLLLTPMVTHTKKGKSQPGVGVLHTEYNQVLAEQILERWELLGS